MSLRSSRPVSNAATFARDLVTLYRERDIPFMAGSIAYSGFVSLIPLVLLVVIVASALGGEPLRDYVLVVAGQYLPPTATDVVDRSLSGSGSRIGVSIIGGVTLLWAGLKVFRTLDTAFSAVYRGGTDAGFLAQVKNGVVVLGAMTTAVLVMVVAWTAITFLPSLPVGAPAGLPAARALGFVALVAGLTFAFLPMYYVFPNASLTVREVVPGAVAAAVGWTALQALFQVYASTTSAGDLYGVVGGIILLLTWLYFGAVIVLLGAATNAILSGRARPQSNLPSGGAGPRTW